MSFTVTHLRLLDHADLQLVARVLGVVPTRSAAALRHQIARRMNARAGLRGGQEDCVICYEQVAEADAAHALTCTHNSRMHAACLQEWLQQHTTCPVCRAAVPNPHGNGTVSLPDFADAQAAQGLTETAIIRAVAEAAVQNVSVLVDDAVAQGTDAAVAQAFQERVAVIYRTVFDDMLADNLDVLELEINSILDDRNRSMEAYATFMQGDDMLGDAVQELWSLVFTTYETNLFNLRTTFDPVQYPRLYDALQLALLPTVQVYFAQFTMRNAARFHELSSEAAESEAGSDMSWE